MVSFLVGGEGTVVDESGAPINLLSLDSTSVAQWSSVFRKDLAFVRLSGREEKPLFIREWPRALLGGALCAIFDGRRRWAFPWISSKRVDVAPALHCTALHCTENRLLLCLPIRLVAQDLDC